MKLSYFFALISSLVLVANSGQAQSSLEGFSSGRYEVRSAQGAKKSSRNPASEVKDVVTDVDSVKVRTLSASELEAERKRTAAEEQAKMAAEKALAEKAEAERKAAEEARLNLTQAKEEEKPEVQEPGLTEQAQGLFSSKADKIYEFYREQVHPDDIRNNKLEIEFSPTAVYNDSSSNFSYRDYQSYFTALKVRANVWFTPLIGISGQILFSLGSDIGANDGTASRVSTKYDYLDLGVNFRKFFGVSRKANSIETSILFSDNKMSPSSDNTSRMKLKTTGFGLGLKARFPTSGSYAWVVGGSFFPRIQHDESDTGISAESGNVSESSRLGLEVGGEFKFSRESQLVWNLGMSSEKNLFDDAAKVPDPSTGSTPSNVSATNSLYMFSLGYRWGH
ncbi:hypothetical protein D3C87_112130 [compost metagenome]